VKNTCLKCKEEAKVLYPGDLCPRCYGEKVPGSNELERAWKGFMKKRSTNRMIDGDKKRSGVVAK